MIPEFAEYSAIKTAGRPDWAAAWIKALSVGAWVSHDILVKSQYPDYS